MSNAELAVSCCAASTFIILMMIVVYNNHLQLQTAVETSANGIPLQSSVGMKWWIDARELAEAPKGHWGCWMSTPVVSFDLHPDKPVVVTSDAQGRVFVDAKTAFVIDHGGYRCFYSAEEIDVATLERLATGGLASKPVMDAFEIPATTHATSQWIDLEEAGYERPIQCACLGKPWLHFGQETGSTPRMRLAPRGNGVSEVFLQRAVQPHVQCVRPFFTCFNI